MNTSVVLIFVAFIAATLGITAWASRRSQSRKAYYTAGGQITGTQNGLALAGDFLSAAAFLGVPGLYFAAGFDGFIYGLGTFVGWPIMLFLTAGKLRSLGRYTLTDVLAVRLKETPIRIFAASANLIVLLFYMVAQMVGGGALLKLLLGLDFTYAAMLVGVLMIVYVVFGGMLATTWVQIVKATLLISTALTLAGLVLIAFDFNLGALFQAAIDKHPAGAAIMGPGNLITSPLGAFSLALTSALGTTGLPHVMMRFFTVPNAKAANYSAFIATVLGGGFCLVMIIVGFGTIALLSGNPDYTTGPAQLKGGGNLASLYLADALGGNLFLGFVAAVAFSTILAVVSGLTLAAAATVSHDLYASVIKKGAQTEREELWISRSAAAVFGVCGVGLSLVFQHLNVNILALFATSVAASALFPLLILALYWKPLSTAGALAGGGTGLVGAITCLILGPDVWVALLGHAAPIFPVQYPTVLAMPFAFVMAFAVSLAVPDKK